MHVHLCVCTHMWADGERAALLPVVQHLTPHTIRGIPAIPGTWPRLGGMGMFPFMVVSAAARLRPLLVSRLASTGRYGLACL